MHVKVRLKCVIDKSETVYDLSSVFWKFILFEISRFHHGAFVLFALMEYEAALVAACHRTAAKASSIRSLL